MEIHAKDEVLSKLFNEQLCWGRNDFITWHDAFFCSTWHGTCKSTWWFASIINRNDWLLIFIVNQFDLIRFLFIELIIWFCFMVLHRLRYLHSYDVIRNYILRWFRMGSLAECFVVYSGIWRGVRSNNTFGGHSGKSVKLHIGDFPFNRQLNCLYFM